MFIDWSDSEEMIGLLVEYVSDERNGSAGDPERERFLDDLAQELEVIADRIRSVSAEATIQRLRVLSDSQPYDFAGDVVLDHVRACVEELERIQSQVR